MCPAASQLLDSKGKVSKLGAKLSSSLMELAELECAFIYLPLRKDPFRCSFLPQTIFLCALCPLWIIPHKTHIALQKIQTLRRWKINLGNKTGALFTPEGRKLRLNALQHSGTHRSNLKKPFQSKSKSTVNPKCVFIHKYN